MDRVTFTICCVLLLSRQAVGIVPIGPASSDLGQGQFAIGFDYSNCDHKLSLENRTVTYSGLDTIHLPDTLSNEVELKGYLGKVSYGITERCLIFARLGQFDIASEKDFTWGLGTKITLKELEVLDLGLTAQVNFLNDRRTVSYPGWDYYEEHIDFYVAQITIGPVYKRENFRVYGGPFLVWADGDGGTNGRYVSDGMTVDVKSHFDVKEDLAAGGYIGMSLEIAENFDLMAEYQIVKDSDMFGASLSFKF